MERSASVIGVRRIFRCMFVTAPYLRRPLPHNALSSLLLSLPTILSQNWCTFGCGLSAPASETDIRHFRMSSRQAIVVHSRSAVELVCGRRWQTLLADAVGAHHAHCIRILSFAFVLSSHSLHFLLSAAFSSSDSVSFHSHTICHSLSPLSSVIIPSHRPL